MGNCKEKCLAKLENNNKKTLENLVVFGIILIATIIFINYIWNGNKKSTKKENTSTNFAEQTVVPTNNMEQSNTLEKQIEEILNNLEGVEAVKVLITYSETSSFTPIYNETHSNSTTEEIDDVGGKRTIESTNINKEVVLEESNGKSMPITEKVVMPKVEGVIVAAEGGRKCKYQNKYHTSSICSDRYI